MLHGGVVTNGGGGSAGMTSIVVRKKWIIRRSKGEAITATKHHRAGDANSDVMVTSDDLGMVVTILLALLLAGDRDRDPRGGRPQCRISKPLPPLEHGDN